MNLWRKTSRSPSSLKLPYGQLTFSIRWRNALPTLEEEMIECEHKHFHIAETSHSSPPGSLLLWPILGSPVSWPVNTPTSTLPNQLSLHSCFKWPFEEIYNLIFQHLTYTAILVPNWNTRQQYFSWTHFSTEMIETFRGGKEDASLARNKFLGCLETLELLEKG